MVPTRDLDRPRARLGMLGPDADGDRRAVGGQVAAGQRHRAAAVDGDAAVAADRALQHVHRRGAEEARDEGVPRLGVELDRRPGLLDAALLQHHDPVGHRHRLDLVVGDVDHRGPEPAVQRDQLAAHADAELGVEVRQRLVEQEGLRLLDDGAADRDALALAAGELVRAAGEEVADLQDLGGAGDARGDLGSCRAAGSRGRSAGSARPTCAGRARRTGTPSPCRARRASGGRSARRRSSPRPRSPPRARRSSAAGSTCRSRRGRRRR